MLECRTYMVRRERSEKPEYCSVFEHISKTQRTANNFSQESDGRKRILPVQVRVAHDDDDSFIGIEVGDLQCVWQVNMYC